MNIKQFAACYIAPNEEMGNLIFPLLYKLAPKEILDNQYLSSGFIKSIWLKLNAKQRTQLASRRLNEKDFSEILKIEDKSTVLKALVESQVLNEDQSLELINLNLESVLEAVYCKSDSKKIKHMAAARLGSVTFLKEDINLRENLTSQDLEVLIEFIEKLAPSRELNLYLGLYLHKFPILRDYVVDLPFTNKLLSVFVGSPYLTISKSEKIVTRISQEGSKPSKYFLMALVANPRCSVKALESLSPLLTSGEDDYEVKNLLQQSISKEVIDCSYEDIVDLNLYQRVMKRAKNSNFKPGGRLLDLLVLSQNKNLPKEIIEEILTELRSSIEFHYDLTYSALDEYRQNQPLPNGNTQEPEVTEGDVDLRYLELKLSHMGTSLAWELSNLLNKSFGGCKNTWSTALSIFDQYDGTLGEFIITSKNI